MRLNFRHGIFLAYAVLIAALSLVPSGGEAPPIRHSDKLGHFLAYAGLAFLGLRTFPSKAGRIFALLLAVCYGALLEFVQSFVPGRDMSFWDGIANTLGVLTGAIAFRLRP